MGAEQVHISARFYGVPARRREPQGHRRAHLALLLPVNSAAVLNGQRVVVAAHGNSLRALIMVLDRLTPETIPGMELATGVPIVYRLKPNSTVETKTVLAG